MPPSTQDGARGTLLGLAVGDALGATLEFEPRDAHPLHTEMTGGAPSRWPPASGPTTPAWPSPWPKACSPATGWIRTTCSAASAAGSHTANIPPTGHCFDIGITTRQALLDYRRTGNPFAGPTGERTAGNGSLMRLAPAVLFALHDPAACRTLAIGQGRTTHAAPQALDACAVFAELLRRAIIGEPKQTLLAPQPWDGLPAIQAIAPAPGTASRVTRSAPPATSSTRWKPPCGPSPTPPASRTH